MFLFNTNFDDIKWKMGNVGAKCRYTVRHIDGFIVNVLVSPVIYLIAHSRFLFSLCAQGFIIRTRVELFNYNILLIYSIYFETMTIYCLLSYFIKLLYLLILNIKLWRLAVSWVEPVRTREKTKKKTNSECYVPKRVVWFGRVLESPFSSSSGQTNFKISVKTHYLNTLYR